MDIYTNGFLLDEVTGRDIGKAPIGEILESRLVSFATVIPDFYTNQVYSNAVKTANKTKKQIEKLKADHLLNPSEFAESYDVVQAQFMALYYAIFNSKTGKHTFYTSCEITASWVKSGVVTRSHRIFQFHLDYILLKLSRTESKVEYAYPMENPALLLNRQMFG